MKTPFKVVVTDANQRVALSVIRALGQAGIWVKAVERFGFPYPVGFASRYCREHAFITNPTKDTRSLKEACRGFDLLIPVSINTILAVSRYRSEFQGRISLVLPEDAVLHNANDKEFLIRFAMQLGLPVPKTYFVFGRSELEDQMDEISFPCIVKLKNDEGLYLEPARRYRMAYNREELLRSYDELSAIKATPVVQEWIDGNGFGFSALYDSSKKQVAFFCHRRLREYPVSGGPSTLCESVYDEQLITYGTKILDAFGWRGPAMVEFKWDTHQNEFKLLEINPRFWGSLPLAVACGVNFPKLLVDFTQGKEGTVPSSYKVGKRLRFLWTDLLAARDYFKDGKNKFQFLGQYMLELLDPRIQEGWFWWSDLGPAFAYLKNKWFLQKET